MKKEGKKISLCNCFFSKQPLATITQEHHWSWESRLRKSEIERGKKKAQSSGNIQWMITLTRYAFTAIGTLRVSIYYLYTISWGQSSQKLDLPRPEKYFISASALPRPVAQIIILSWPCTVCKCFMNGNYTDSLFCMNIHSLCLYTQKMVMDYHYPNW